MFKPEEPEESPFHFVASEKRLRVTLLSSEWKSSKGGSAFNRELAIELAKHPNVEIYVYVPKCSEEDKKVAAGRHGIQLIEAEEIPGCEPIDWLASLPEGHLPHCVIGHGFHLGRQIPLIKQRHHDCKWIQVVHTAPEELGMYKRYEEAIFKGQQKHQAELQLCELADQVVAVGYKLANVYSRYLRYSGKDQDVISLTPSIFTEFLSVQQAPEERRSFVVLVFGRGDGEHFKLKGYDIAVQAVAELKDSSYRLMFVGAQAGKEDEVTDRLLQHGIPRSQLIVRRFMESREWLAKLFCEVDLAIMPSRTEDFGLTALEALSAGLPVLVSGNSGLGDALKKVPSGFSHVVDSEDPKEWAKAINIVRQKGREVRLAEAKFLRERYAMKYNWQEQCDYLVEKMLNLSLENRGDKLERMKKELADIKEELDALIINRPPLEERILRIKENLKETLEQMGHQMKNVSEKVDSLRESIQDEDELQQINSEMGNISDKLHTLIAQRKVDGEDKMRDDLNEMKREIRTFSEKLKSKTTSGEVPPEIVVRGRFALEAYNKALAEGKTFDKRVPVMLIGRYQSGKTSLKKSLKRELFKQKEESTVGIDVDPSYFELSSEILTMSEKDQETKTSFSYEHHVARATVEHMQTRRAPVSMEKSPEAMPSGNVPAVSASTHDPVVVGTNSSSSPKTVIQANRSDRTSNEPNELQIADESIQTTRQAENEDSKLHIPNDVQTEMIKFLENDFKVGDEEVHCVLWDFAGQSVYYTTHPIFLTSRAIYLLAYDLSQKPDQKPEAVPKQGQFERFLDSCGLEFNSDYLDFWMSSVASLACQEESDRVSSESEVLPEKLPAVFLVCTHADTPYDSLSDAKTLANKLYGSLRTKPYKRHLYDDVFVVDNTKSGRGSECPEVKRLRGELLTVAKELPQMKEPIPIRWLNYEKNLQAKRNKRDEKWIDLQEAKRTASEECNIVEDREFQTVLNFLHDRRILIHFSDTKMLDRFVVLDPQWLIDVFKKVITIPPRDSKEKKFEGLWCKLQEKGILEKKLLDHVWSTPSFDKETTESLLGIMEKFSLLCSWPSSDASCEKQYLVPSMLTTPPTEDVRKLVEDASEQIPPLVVKFESGLVPPGLFPRLVLLFLQWGKENCVNPVKPLLYHNFARCFISEDTSQSVVLLCLSSSIKVVVHRGNGIQESGAGCLPSMTSLSVDVSYDNLDVTFASSVCRQLELILESMRNEFCWLKNMRYELSFICPVCCEGGIVVCCDTHRKQGCKQEECFHFWSLSELCNSKGAINCHESATAKKTQIDIRQFAPWLVSSGYRLTVGERNEGGLANLKGKEIALPDEVQKSLSSPSCDAKAVVLQLKETKQLDQASLKEPDLETKTMIQCFVRKAKDSNRLDVVRYLRKITPAGTTGPLLPEQLNVQDIPVPNRKDLTINLSGGEEWKEVAERLGLTQPEIRFLDNRTLNPFDAALAFIAMQKNITVANLYDLLNECGYPVIADLL